MEEYIFTPREQLFDFSMSPDKPKKGRQKIPGSRMKILTKDAKQMVNGPYYCPKCRKELLQIYASTKTKEVFAVCKCGLEWSLTYAPVFQPIDYYNKFRDAWKKQSYGIIKEQK
jgi:transcription elongation factor Elf1